MNKFNNPRLTNTTVSGTGVKHPMRPHVILGDPENGFIRGDLLDANAVIKLIKNAAKAIGALEELEQSNWIDDDATTVEPMGILDNGEVGVYVLSNGKKALVLNNAGVPKILARDESNQVETRMSPLYVENEKAYGKTVENAVSSEFVIIGPVNSSLQKGEVVDYSTLSSSVIKYASMG